MIIESIREYNLDPDDAANFYSLDYQEFIAFSDNEDTWDFVVYLIDKIGVQQIVTDLGLQPEGAIDRAF
jgi:hypothetical protein